MCAAAIGIAPLPREYEDKAWMRALTANMNKRHLMAQLAGRASVALHTNMFFKARVSACGAVLRVVRFPSRGMSNRFPRTGSGLTASFALNP